MREQNRKFNKQVAEERKEEKSKKLKEAMKLPKDRNEEEEEDSRETGPGKKRTYSAMDGEKPQKSLKRERMVCFRSLVFAPLVDWIVCTGQKIPDRQQEEQTH